MRLKKDEVEKLGAAAYVVLPQDLYRTKVYQEENLLAVPVLSGPISPTSPFAKDKSMVWATALSDPAGYASALYGVARKFHINDNAPYWFVIDRKGTLTYASAVKTHVQDVDRVLQELKKAAR